MRFFARSLLPAGALESLREALASAASSVRKKRGFAICSPPEEILKRPLHSFDYLLKHLRRHFIQFWANVFASRQLGALMFGGEGNACHAKGTFAFIGGCIVGLAARLVVCEGLLRYYSPNTSCSSTVSAACASVVLQRAICSSRSTSHIPKYAIDKLG